MDPFLRPSWPYTRIYYSQHTKLWPIENNNYLQIINITFRIATDWIFGNKIQHYIWWNNNTNATHTLETSRLMIRTKISTSNTSTLLPFKATPTTTTPRQNKQTAFNNYDYSPHINTNKNVALAHIRQIQTTTYLSRLQHTYNSDTYLSNKKLKWLIQATTLTTNISEI